jgi:hypothetical protein
LGEVIALLVAEELMSMPAFDSLVGMEVNYPMKSELCGQLFMQLQTHPSCSAARAVAIYQDSKISIQDILAMEREDDFSDEKEVRQRVALS